MANKAMEILSQEPSQNNPPSKTEAMNSFKSMMDDISKLSSEESKLKSKFINMMNYVDGKEFITKEKETSIRNVQELTRRSGMYTILGTYGVNVGNSLTDINALLSTASYRLAQIDENPEGYKQTYIQRVIIPLSQQVSIVEKNKTEGLMVLSEVAKGLYQSEFQGTLAQIQQQQQLAILAGQQGDVSTAGNHEQEARILSEKIPTLGSWIRSIVPDAGILEELPPTDLIQPLDVRSPVGTEDNKNQGIPLSNDSQLPYRKDKGIDFNVLPNPLPLIGI